MAVFHTGRRWRWCVVFANCEQKPVFVGEGEKNELWVDSMSFGLELGGIFACV